MNDFFPRHQSKILILSTCLVLAACAHEPPNELVLAREAYQRASTGQAAQLKPDEVHKAATALQIAEQSFSDEPESVRTRDLAYIAERRAEIAEALAAGKAAELQRGSANQAYQKRQIQKAQHTERQLGQVTEQLGQTRQQLGQTQDQLQQAQQASQKTEQQLTQEQQARAAAEQQAKESERQATEAAQQAKQANDALLGLQAKEEARGMVITLSGSVLFASNAAALLPEAQTRLNQVADALMQTKERNVVIEGHTDSRGSAALNMSLSQRRAQAVRDYLVSRGYPSDKIEARGIGADRPIADNKSAEGRANNRRVEIIVAPRSSVSSATP